jgi:hypothetical protein
VTNQHSGQLAWRKSSYSADTAACVEIAETADGIAVRDSKCPDGPMLSYGVASWRVFIADVRKGHFDLPTL